MDFAMAFRRAVHRIDVQENDEVRSGLYYDLMAGTEIFGWNQGIGWVPRRVIVAALGSGLG